jgi:hypothetical protein
MAAKVPQLTHKALQRIEEVSRAQGMSPDEVVLQFIPAPTSQKVAAILRQAKTTTQDPKALKRAEAQLRKLKPVISDEEAGVVAREAVIRHRARKKAKPK